MDQKVKEARRKSNPLYLQSTLFNCDTAKQGGTVSVPSNVYWIIPVMLASRSQGLQGCPASPNGDARAQMRPQNYFYGIDLIRFCAALSVVGFHLGYFGDSANFKLISPITWFGWIGVEVFFVISGFVIANSASGSSPMQFLKGRALRLYPAVWICGTITLIARLTADDGSVLQLYPTYIRSLALIPKGPWIDSVYWTLAVEIGFYLLIFGILYAGKFSALSRIALALTTLSSLYLCFLAARLLDLLPPSQFLVFMDGHQGLSNILLARHGCFFALGTWLWISTTRPLAAFERAAIPVAIIACIGEICLRAAELPHPPESPNWMLAPVLSWGAATACVFCFSRTSGLTMFAGAKRLRIIGLMTYPLYLVHNTVGNSIIGFLIAMGVNKWAALTFGIFSMIFLSWIVCEFCEPPIRKMLAMVFDRLASRRSLAPSTKSLS